MRQELIDLNEIQKIDLGIREVEKRRDLVPKKLHELQAEIIKAKADIAVRRKELDSLDIDRRALDGAIQAETLKLKKWDKRLADIRNQREYLALSREIETSKRTNREAEERIAEINKRTKVLTEELDKFQDTLAECEVDCNSEQEMVDRVLAEFEVSVAAERIRRDALYPKISKIVLRKYESVRDKRAGMGLAVVVGGCCSGCNMRLPPQLFIMLQRTETVEQCPSCLRIMVWDSLLQPPAS